MIKKKKKKKKKKKTNNNKRRVKEKEREKEVKKGCSSEDTVAPCEPVAVWLWTGPLKVRGSRCVFDPA